MSEFDLTNFVKQENVSLGVLESLDKVKLLAIATALSVSVSTQMSKSDLYQTVHDKFVETGQLNAGDGPLISNRDVEVFCIGFRFTSTCWFDW